MVRNEDQRAQALRAMGAEVVVGDLLDLNWSGLPIVHVRPTVFMENFFLLFAADSVRASDKRRS